MDKKSSCSSQQSFHLDTKDSKLSSTSCISLSTADFDTLFEIAKERQEDDETSLCDSPKLNINKHRPRSERGHRHKHAYLLQNKPKSLDTDHFAHQRSGSCEFRKHHVDASTENAPDYGNDVNTSSHSLNTQKRPQNRLLAPETCSNDKQQNTSYDNQTEETAVETPSSRHRQRLSTKAHSTDSASSHNSGSDSSSLYGFRRVRSFRITSHGIEKEDLVVKSSKESTKNSFINRATREGGRGATLVNTGSSNERHKTYRVLLLGSEGVGKRAMIYDFMMPDDYLEQLGFTTDDDEGGEKSVSILLDGEESTLEFVDLSDEEIDRFVSTEHIDAYVVVYSVEDRRSFETAIDRLYDIRQEDDREVAVILVANKTDLVRTRVIFEEEGKAAANTYDCKYIEVSAAIDHKIDELLVGILKQIRLIKELRGSKHHQHRRSSSSEQKDSDKKFCCPLRAKHTVMERLFGKTKRSAKSCENLYVL